MRDRSPRAAGADHGGDCGSGACAWLLFSLRLDFRLSLRPVAADTAAPGTFEPYSKWFLPPGLALDFPRLLSAFRSGGEWQDEWRREPSQQAHASAGRAG